MMGFPKEMLIRVSAILLLTDLVIFARVYWFTLSASLVIVISIIEMLVIAVTFAYLVSKYKLRW
jgi:hypothetical protein